MAIHSFFCTYICLLAHPFYKNKPLRKGSARVADWTYFFSLFCRNFASNKIRMFLLQILD